MKSKIVTQVKHCQVCKEGKYEGLPTNPQTTETPIPKFPGHTIHIDIISTDKNGYLRQFTNFQNLRKQK